MRFTATCPHCGTNDHPEPFSDQHLCWTSCGSCKRGYWFDVLENAASAEHPKDVQRNRLEALEAALRQARSCAYPVSTEIDPRGHRWSEAYLDQLLPTINTLLKD
jgi:hypothetical protein